MFHSNEHWAKSKRFVWIQQILTYFKNNPSIDFEAVIDRALHKFFPSEHESIIPGTSEQDLADTRFWDFLLFEYRDEKLDQKTPVEFACAHAELPKKSKDYLDVIQKKHFYSLFKVIKVNEGESIILDDLAKEGVYEVKEYKATFQLKAHDVLMWRIVPDEEGDWRFAPGNPSLIDRQVAMPLIHGLERIKKKGAQKKTDSFTALMVEGLMHKEREDTDFKKDLQLERDEQIVADFLVKYESSLTLEDLKNRLYEETDKDYRNFFPWLIDKCKKMPDKEAIASFFETFRNVSNHTSRKIFGGQTPAERNRDRDFPLGPTETTLKQDFFQTAAHYFDENSYPSARVINHKAEEFQKIWLDSPQPALDGKTPMQAILEERKSLGNPEKEFGIDYFCNSLDGDAYTLIPTEEIKIKDNALLHDVNVLLNYISKKKNASLALTPKKGEIKESDIDWLLGHFMGKSTVSYESKKGKIVAPRPYEYLLFCVKVAELSGLVKKDGNNLILNAERYEEYSQLNDAQKFLKLFYSWYFASAKDWSFLLTSEDHVGIDLLGDLEHFTEQRESALAHILELSKKESFEDFFWKFYASKRKTINKDKYLLSQLKIIIIQLIIQHFNVFGLLECYTNSNIRDLYKRENVLKLDTLKLTDLGLKLLPHIVDEMYLRDLDRRSVDKDIEAFIEAVNQNSATSFVPNRPEIGRNDSCPCGSGKKYKKCCL